MSGSKKEEIFVKTFILRKRKERSLFELGSRKKRPKFLNKLSHGYMDTLDGRFMESIPVPNSDPSDIFNLLRKHGAPDLCYAISSNDDLDGKEVPLIEALQIAVGYGLPSILLCIPDKLAYFEAEQEIGPPPRYLLKKA